MRILCILYGKVANLLPEDSTFLSRSFQSDQEIIVNLKHVSLMMICVALTACAATNSMQEKNTPPSAEKRILSERLLQREKFVLVSGPKITPPYSIEFYPLEGEMKVNTTFKNECFSGLVPAKFWVSHDFENVSVRTVGLVTGCPTLQHNIDPITGIAGEYVKEVNGEWPKAAYRFYLKKD